MGYALCGPIPSSRAQATEPPGSCEQWLGDYSNVSRLIFKAESRSEAASFHRRCFQRELGTFIARRSEARPRYFQMNDRRNGSEMAAASFANDSPTVAGRNQPDTFALHAYLPSLRVDDGASPGAMVLHLILDRPFAFFTSISLADGAGYLPGFVVLKFDEELPLGKDGVLTHTNRL